MTERPPKAFNDVLLRCVHVCAHLRMCLALAVSR